MKPIQIVSGSHIPIYRQISQQLKIQILTGEIPQGEKLPSVRTLASQLGVNPLTIQRVFQELKAEELIFQKRGDGMYVAEIIESASDINPKRKELESMIRELKNTARTFGFGTDEVIKIILTIMKEEESS